MYLYCAVKPQKMSPSTFGKTLIYITKEMYHAKYQNRKRHCSLWFLSPGNNELKRLWKLYLEVQKISISDGQKLCFKCKEKYY